MCVYFQHREIDNLLFTNKYRIKMEDKIVYVRRKVDNMIKIEIHYLEVEGNALFMPQICCFHNIINLTITFATINKGYSVGYQLYIIT